MTSREERELLESLPPNSILYSVLVAGQIPERTREGVESAFALRVAEAIREGRSRKEFYRHEAYNLIHSMNPKTNG